MPRLHKYRDRNACYVLTAIRGAVVTYQLTSDGERKLTTAGRRSDRTTLAGMPPVQASEAPLGVWMSHV